MTTCILCGTAMSPGTTRGIQQVQDYSISQETFNLQHCSNCDLTQTAFTKYEELHKYYESVDYASHELNPTNPIHIAYKLARTITVRRKVAIVQELVNQKTVLDFGCGTGYYLKTLKENGWQIEGIEPSEKARTKATEETGQSIKKEINEVSGKFQAITLWHVLEHTQNPIETILKLRLYLEPNGIILIAVPNPNSWDANHYGKFWAGYDVPRHLWHFSQKSISKLAEKAGFKLIKTYPMHMDSYYVSLLSEKYIVGKQSIPGLIKAMRSGHKSNKEAWKTGEYSSLIYILKQ